MWQPWRDVWKLLHKQTIAPEGTSALWRAAPIAVFALSWFMAVLAPAFATDLVLLRGSNVFFVLLLMAAIHLVLIRVAIEAGRGAEVAPWQPVAVRAVALVVVACACHLGCGDKSTAGDGCSE